MNVWILCAWCMLHACVNVREHWTREIDKEREREGGGEKMGEISISKYVYLLILLLL